MSTAERTPELDLDLGGGSLQSLGRPIKGPSALGSDPKRLFQLTWVLAKTEFKLAFFGSVLGYLWQLMRPLLLFGVIYGVISIALGKNFNTPFFGVSLLLGIVMFNFYSESSGGAVTSLLTRENLVRKIDFPRMAVPLAVVLTALFNFSLNMVPVLIFLLAAGGSISLGWIGIPFLMVTLAAFTAGLGMILSVAYVSYRDVRPIWEVVLQMTFYASPIFYPITKVDKNYDVLGVPVNIAHVMLANPFVAILVQARHMLISPAYPSAYAAMGGGALILIPIGILVATVVVGFVVFDRRAPKVAEQL